MRVALGALLEREAMFHGTHHRYSAAEDSLAFRTLDYAGVLVRVDTASAGGFRAEAIAEGTERWCAVHVGDASFAWTPGDRAGVVRCLTTAPAPIDTPGDARR